MSGRPGGKMNSTLAGVCLGLAVGLIGVGTLISGYVVPGIIALVVLAFVVLGFVASRARSSRLGSSGGGIFYGGTAGSAGGHGGDNDGGNGDGGGMRVAPTVVVASMEAAGSAGETAEVVGEARRCRGVASRGWSGCYHACGELN